MKDFKKILGAINSLIGAVGLFLILVFSIPGPPSINGGKADFGTFLTLTALLFLVSGISMLHED